MDEWVSSLLLQGVSQTNLAPLPSLLRQRKKESSFYEYTRRTAFGAERSQRKRGGNSGAPSAQERKCALLSSTVPYGLARQALTLLRFFPAFLPSLTTPPAHLVALLMRLAYK